jgi:hypothetical protein
LVSASGTSFCILLRQQQFILVRRLPAAASKATKTLFRNTHQSINLSKGERWFYSEAEALAAGCAKCVSTGRIDGCYFKKLAYTLRLGEPDYAVRQG